MGHLVLESAEFIVSKAKDVSIPSEGVESLANTLAEIHQKGGFSLASWTEHPLNPKPWQVGDENALAWIIIVDTLNFCFWSDSEQLFTVNYQSKSYTGYMSLVALINRAIDEGIPIREPQYLKDLTDEQAEHIFRSDSSQQIPQHWQRIRVLKELGSVICEKFGGKWENLIKAADHSALKLVDIVVENISSFDDKCEFEGRIVYLRKRAQILVADIWACFQNKGYGQFNDIDSITMFADYRVPQALVYFGAIKYTDTLLEKLKTEPALAPGSRLEVEIRGASIWAVELVRQRVLEKLGTKTHSDAPFNAIVIDFYLWDYAKAHSAEMSHIPIHKTTTQFY